MSDKSEREVRKSALNLQIDELKQDNTMLRRDMEKLKREMERYKVQMQQVMKKGAQRSDVPATKKQLYSKPSSTRTSPITSRQNSNLTSPITSKPNSNLTSPTTSRPTSKANLLSPNSSQNLSTIREHLSATLAPNVTTSYTKHNSTIKSPSTSKPTSRTSSTSTVKKMCNCNYAITPGVECGCQECYRGSIGTPCTPIHRPEPTPWSPPVLLLDPVKIKHKSPSGSANNSPSTSKALLSPPHPSILTSQKDHESHSSRKGSLESGRTLHWEDGGNMPSSSDAFGNAATPVRYYNAVETTYVSEGLRRNTISETEFIAERKRRESQEDLINGGVVPEYFPSMVVGKQMFLKSSAPYKSTAPDLGLTSAPPLVEKLSVKEIIDTSDGNTARVIREFLGMSNPDVDPASQGHVTGKDGFLVIGDESGSKTFITKTRATGSSPCVCGSHSRQVDARGANSIGGCVCGRNKSKSDVGCVIAPRNGLSSSRVVGCVCHGSIALPMTQQSSIDDVVVETDGQSANGKELVIKISQDKEKSKEIQLKIDNGLGNNGKGYSVKIDPVTKGSGKTIVIRICNNEDN